LIGLLAGLGYLHINKEAEHIALHEAESIARTFAFNITGHAHPERRSGLKDLQGLQEHILQFKRIHERDIVIVDVDQQILADAVPEEIGNIFNHDSNDEVGQTIRDGKIRIFNETSKAYPHGIKSLVIPLDSNIGERKGAVILEYTPLYEEILRQVRNSAKRFLMYFAGALAFALATGYMISRNISMPLREMQEAVKKVAGGNLDARVKYDSSDELGSLAESFNKMASDIKFEITERKKVEELIKESEKRFRAAFENAAVGASMANLEGRFIKVNRFLCDMIGYSEEELLSRTFSEVTHPDDVQIGLDAVKKMLSGEAAYTSFEKRYLRKDGQLINVIISPALIRDGDGNPQYFVALFQDITERKLAEKRISESLKEKEVLLKEIHHRVKNNLSIIYALLQLQARHSKDENITSVFRDSQSRIKSMALVHEKLYQTQDFTSISFKEYADEMIKYLLHTYRQDTEDIGYKLYIDDIFFGIDTMIPCGLIINELVTNSLKHAFKGIERPEISIALNMDDGQATLVYSDNGSGMPENINFPVSETLGLQIINMLAFQLKGEIELERKGGTKFIIRFVQPKHQ
jgi:PAS domain S-box-containing protein